MSLSQKQLEDVCLLHVGDSGTCRYLRSDETYYNTFCCMKLRPNEQKKIDLKIGQFVRDCRKKNVNPHSANVPLGDNCAGYPVLKHVQQGYDC